MGGLAGLHRILGRVHRILGGVWRILDSSGGSVRGWVGGCVERWEKGRRVGG